MTTAATYDQEAEQGLLDRLAGGEEAALDALYRKYWEWLFVFAFNILKDKQSCEDIVQDVFVRVWTNRNKLKIDVSLKAYLFASTRYAVYRLIKTERVREEVFDDLQERWESLSASDQLEHQELASAFQRIIDDLPPRCREVYLLSRDEQLTYKQIAERLGISVKAVEHHMHRALQDLKKALPGLMTLDLFLQLLRR